MIARATHERVLAGWYAFKSDTSERRRYRHRQIIGLGVWLVPVGIGDLLVVGATPDV